MGSYGVKIEWRGKKVLSERASRDAKYIESVLQTVESRDEKKKALHELMVPIVEAEVANFVAQAVACSDKKIHLFWIKKPGSLVAPRIMTYRQVLVMLENYIATARMENRRDSQEIYQRLEGVARDADACQEAGRSNQSNMLHREIRREKEALFSRSAARWESVLALQNEYIRLGENLLAEQKLLREKAFARILFYQTQVSENLGDPLEFIISRADLIIRGSDYPDQETARLLEEMRKARDAVLRQEKMVAELEQIVNDQVVGQVAVAEEEVENE